MKEYYRHIGRLAYAVAMADGAIQEEEVLALRNSVLRDFAAHETSVDSSGMNQAFYVDFAFEECMQKKTDKNEIIRKFADYLDTSCEKDDAALLERSLQLLRKIARAYARNREELIIETVSNKINKVLEQY